MRLNLGTLSLGNRFKYYNVGRALTSGTSIHFNMRKRRLYCLQLDNKFDLKFRIKNLPLGLYLGISSLSNHFKDSVGEAPASRICVHFDYGNCLLRNFNHKKITIRNLIGCQFVIMRHSNILVI